MTPRATAITKRIEPEPGPFEADTPQPDGLAHATALVGAPPTRVEAPATSIEPPAVEAKGELVEQPDRPEGPSLVARVADLEAREAQREAHITELARQCATVETASARAVEALEVRCRDLEAENVALRARLTADEEWVGKRTEGGV